MPEHVSINPGRFTDALDEGFHPVGLARAPFKNERKKLVAWLRKKFADDAVTQALADKLENCKPSARCKSAACPECSKAAQNLFVRITKQFLKTPAIIDHIVCVTIVPADGVIDPGRLKADQHLRDVRRWKDALTRAGVGWFVGGIDYSFNEHDANRYSPHWAKHIYGFAETASPDQFKRQLQEQFRATDVIPRPVKAMIWDGGKCAVRYALKGTFQRRIARDNGKRYDPKSGDIRACRDTDHQPLRSDQKRELLVHLDQIGIAGRLMLRGVQFMKLRGTGPTLVIRRPLARDREIGQRDELDPERRA